MPRNQHHDSPVQLQHYLKGVDYPASKDDLINAARGNGAPDEVMGILQRMPDNRFEGPPGVMKAYGEHR